MTNDVTNAEARAALESVEESRQHVIGEIDMPSWYWLGLALGWVGVGVVADLGHPWLTLGATSVFGAIHASVSGLVIGGRHRTTKLSVHADVAGRHTPLLVFTGLIGLALVTIAGALAVSADDARHPATIASILVAVMILLGGPQLMTLVRRRAVQNASLR